MRIALVDTAKSNRRFSPNRFASLADVLTANGHELLILAGAPEPDRTSAPVLTGLNRAVSAKPMIEAHRVGRHLAKFDPNLVIAPLGGGIAQGILMARACGEAFASTRVALWCDPPSRARFLSGDDLSTGLATLIADSLERQALSLADALIVPDKDRIECLSRLVAQLPPLWEATLPTSLPAPLPAQFRDIKEIVFLGPCERSCGIVEFIEVMQRLSNDGMLADRIVTFVGMSRSSAQGVSKEWLGLRAVHWPFFFKVIDSLCPRSTARYLEDPCRLAVAIGEDPDDIEFVRQYGTRHCIVPSSTGQDLLVDRIEAALRASLGASPPRAMASKSITDWANLTLRLATLPIDGLNQGASVLGTTVCILHHNRLSQLSTALASVPTSIEGNPVEIIVVDNASDCAFIEDEIRHRAGTRPHLRIIRFVKPVPQATALNRALAEARFDTILFLDDDNAYLPDGVRRMAQAIAVSGFDIVVSPLDLVDGESDLHAKVAGRLIFLGAAHSAGLFFNGFGDTAMIVRRQPMLNLGGFHDPGYGYPCLDWVTLAKAQASGMRIGALQSSAVLYRRDTARADLSANKLDQEGARMLVFEAYRGNFDRELVGRFAQKLQLNDL